MFQTDPGKDRWQLGFQDSVLSSFDFLSTYGLRPVEESATFVRYESSSVFVNVYHGRASFEIGVEIGRRDRPEKYGLDYIVSWAGKRAWEAEMLTASRRLWWTVAEDPSDDRYLECAVEGEAGCVVSGDTGTWLG